MSATVASLSSHRLLMLEAAINVAQKYFVDAGEALAEIRDAQLYQEAGFASFEAYCAERWDMSRARAYQLIAAAAVHSNCLQLLTDPPHNEAQCRELAKLPPEKQPEVWAKAVETAPEGKVTAKHVASVIKSMLGEADGTSTTTATAPPATTDDADIHEAWANDPHQSRMALRREIAGRVQALLVEHDDHPDVLLEILQQHVAVLQRVVGGR